MYKATLFGIAVVAMLSSVASAQIIIATSTPPDPAAGFKLQTEAFAIGAGNLLTLSGAGGTAQNANTVAIFQNQDDCKPCSWGNQNQVVTFSQVGNIGAQCGGAWGILQGAAVGGNQWQLIGDGCGPKVEHQNLLVDLGNGLTKNDGSGAAIASHAVGVVQNQNAGNSAGLMSQTNAVAAGQNSIVAGGPCTDATVGATLVVGTTQTNVDM